MGETDFVNAPVCVLAVDPGLSGAVCRLGKGHCDARRDFKSLADISNAIRELSSDTDSAVIEFVHSRPGEGTVSVFSFGRSTGVAFGALFLEGFGSQKPLEEVHPTRWQNFFRRTQGIPKELEFDSKSIASSIVPSYAPQLFSRVKDHGTADAFLMAAYRLLNEPLSIRLLSPRLLQGNNSARRRIARPPKQKVPVQPAPDSRERGYAPVLSV
jgi:hypothetical protein